MRSTRPHEAEALRSMYKAAPRRIVSAPTGLRTLSPAVQRRAGAKNAYALGGKGEKALRTQNLLYSAMTTPQQHVKRPVVFAGENPLIMLYRPASDQLAAVASLWHCTYSEQGAGHSLVLWVDPAAAEPTGLQPTGIYTDNAALARWVWTTFNRRWEPLQNRGLAETEPQPARFVEQANGRRSHRIVCMAGPTTIELLWQDGQDAFYTVTYPYEYEVSAVIVPCARASITIDGQPVAGEVRPHADVFQSSAIMAFCETWLAR